MCFSFGCPCSSFLELTFFAYLDSMIPFTFFLYVVGINNNDDGDYNVNITGTEPKWLLLTSNSFYQRLEVKDAIVHR